MKKMVANEILHNRLVYEDILIRFAETSEIVTKNFNEY
jgi:hypothetical protein